MSCSRVQSRHQKSSRGLQGAAKIGPHIARVHESTLKSCPEPPHPGRGLPLSTLTHPHSLVLHVDGRNAGPKEQRSPAGNPDSVKVSIILRVGKRYVKGVAEAPLNLPLGPKHPHHTASLSSTPKDVTAKPLTQMHHHSFPCASGPVMDARDRRHNEGHHLGQVCGLNPAHHLLL